MLSVDKGAMQFQECACVCVAWVVRVGGCASLINRMSWCMCALTTLSSSSWTQNDERPTSLVTLKNGRRQISAPLPFVLLLSITRFAHTHTHCLSVCVSVCLSMCLYVSLCLC